MKKKSDENEKKYTNSKINKKKLNNEEKSFKLCFIE